jgi:hypothetical protein
MLEVSIAACIDDCKCRFDIEAARPRMMELELTRIIQQLERSWASA